MVSKFHPFSFALECSHVCEYLVQLVSFCMCCPTKDTKYSKLFEILLNAIQLLVKISHYHNLCIGILLQDTVLDHIIDVSQSLFSVCSVIRFHIAVYYVDWFIPGLYYRLPSYVTAKGFDVFDLMASLDAGPTSCERFMHSLAVVVFSQCHILIKFSLL